MQNLIHKPHRTQNGVPRTVVIEMFSVSKMRGCVLNSSANRSIGSTTGCTITEKAPTSAFTFKTLLRHYAKRALTPRSNVKLGPRRNYHNGRAAIRHYAIQTARPL